MVPFKSLGAVFYLPSSVTMALSCISSENPPILVENRDFFIPPLAFATPVRGVLVGIVPSRLVWKN